MAFSALPSPIQAIWSSARSALVYVQANLSSSNTTNAAILASAMFSTMVNARDAISAAQATTSLSQLYNGLEPILTFPLTLGAGMLELINARIASIQLAALSIETLVPKFSQPSQALVSGNPTISSVGYVEWQMAFAFEIAPAMSTPADLMAAAQNEAAAWAQLLIALEEQAITYTGTTYDLANQMAAATAAAASDLSNVTISPNAPLSQVWNLCVAWPAILRVTNAISTDPTSAGAQQTAVVRLLALQGTQQFAALIFSLRQAPQQQQQQQIRMAQVRQGDTLMTLAARELGDYTQWYAIAQANSLVPPFISTARSPGVAISGDNLFLPTGNTQVIPEAQPSYATNYLGIDIYYGPLNQPMLPWTGDFQTISGYSNLSVSLGRRLQTPLTALIYHTDFGSRIPMQVGSVYSLQTTSHIAAYAQSALLSDPRVNQVTNLNAAFGQNYSVTVTATIIPNGQTGQSVPVNEVLQP